MILDRRLFRQCFWHSLQTIDLPTGACLNIPREPRWLCKGADARRAAPAVVDSTDKPRNAADAPCRANPKGPDGFAFIRRCRLLIGSHPTSSAPPRLKANPFGRGHVEYSDRLLGVEGAIH